MDDAELRQTAAEQWPHHDWSTAEVLHGAFHLVVIPPDPGVVLRVVTGHGFEARRDREVGIIRTLSAADLPLPVPALLADPITTATWSGFGTVREVVSGSELMDGLVSRCAESVGTLVQDVARG